MAPSAITDPKMSPFTTSPSFMNGKRPATTIPATMRTDTRPADSAGPSRRRGLRRPPAAGQQQSQAEIEKVRNRLEEAVKGFHDFLDVVERAIELVPAKE